MRLPNFAPLDSMPGGLDQVTRADVVAEARCWIDTPYTPHARANGVGVDNVGLVVGVCRELGLAEPHWDASDVMTLLCDCTAVREDDVKPGHVLILESRQGQHLAILGDYLHGGFSLIHAFGSTDGKGRVEEWVWLNDRRGFRPLAAFNLRGVR